MDSKFTFSCDSAFCKCPTVSSRDTVIFWVRSPAAMRLAHLSICCSGDTNTEYDPSGHALVMLMGNFEVQEPTAAQLGAATELLVWLARQHGLTADAIASHRDFSQQTVCPGRALYAQLPALRGWAAAEATASARRAR